MTLSIYLKQEVQLHVRRRDHTQTKSIKTVHKKFSMYKNKIFYSISLSYIFALKQASFWYEKSCVICSDKGLMLNKSNAPVLKKDTWKMVFKKRPLAFEQLWDVFRAKIPPPQKKLIKKKEDGFKGEEGARVRVRDVQTIQRRSSRPMFREKRSGMCLRSTFWLSFEAMLEMALLVMSPCFSLCYVRVLKCVKSKPMCARSNECV